MTVFQAHVMLAATIGDIIDTTNVVQVGTATSPSLMPDGARLTASLRDVCLTRALYDIYRGAVQASVSAPRNIATKMLQGLSIETIVKIQWLFANISSSTAILPAGFKHVFDFNNVAVGATVPGAWKPLYIYSLNIVKTTGVYYPVPIKSSMEANGLMNARNVQVADTFAVPVGNGLAAFSPTSSVVELFDRQGDFVSGDTLECTYMPLPAIINSSTIGGINRIIELDSIRISNLITLAQMYAHINAQDIESIEQYLPTMLDLQKGQ